MDLKAIIASSIESLLASGEIEKAISAQLSKTIQESVLFELKIYSKFGEKLQKAVREALVIHGEIDLPSYNDLILKIVARQMETQTNAILEKQVAERLKELLTPAPESIKLSELVEQFIERVKDKVSSGCVCYGETGGITLHIDKQDSGFTYVHLDEEPKKKPNECGIRFGIHKEEIFSLTFGNRDVEKQMFVGPFYNFERSLFQMKAAKTKLLIDADVEDIATTFELAHS